MQNNRGGKDEVLLLKFYICFPLALGNEKAELKRSGKFLN